MFAPKNILVPTDFSQYSDKAFKEAVILAEKFKSKIYLLHVYDEGIQQCVVDYCLPVEQVMYLGKRGHKGIKRTHGKGSPCDLGRVEYRYCL